MCGVLIWMFSVNHVVFGNKQLEVNISHIFVFFLLRRVGITGVICVKELKRESRHLPGQIQSGSFFHSQIVQNLPHLAILRHKNRMNKQPQTCMHVGYVHSTPSTCQLTRWCQPHSQHNIRSLCIVQYC